MPGFLFLGLGIEVLVVTRLLLKAGGTSGVAIAAVPAAQPMRVLGSELVAPEADRLVGDEDAPSGEKILDVPVA